MALNVFEGARRINLIVAALWVLGWAAAGIFSSPPSVTTTYATLGPDRPFTISSDSCYLPDASKYKYITTKTGTSVSITLCFKALPFQDGQMFVPYRADRTSNQYWGNRAYSEEVTAYTDSVVKAFSIPQADEADLDKLAWPLRLQQIGWGVLGMLAGLVFLFAFSWTVGWIVRGFLGIPKEQDHRTN